MVLPSLLLHLLRVFFLSLLLWRSPFWLVAVVVVVGLGLLFPSPPPPAGFLLALAFAAFGWLLGLVGGLAWFGLAVVACFFLDFFVLASA